MLGQRLAADASCRRRPTSSPTAMFGTANATASTISGWRDDFALDFGRADAKALGLDHVVAAGDEIQVALLVAIDLVAAEHQRLARKPRMGAEDLAPCSPGSRQ